MLLIVLYHSNVSWIPGGFIGVDIFFVISGFLITGLLVNEAWASRRIVLADFYTRRVRRLLPAALDRLARDHGWELISLTKSWFERLGLAHLWLRDTRGRASTVHAAWRVTGKGAAKRQTPPALSIGIGGRRRPCRSSRPSAASSTVRASAEASTSPTPVARSAIARSGAMGAAYSDANHITASWAAQQLQRLEETLTAWKQRRCHDDHERCHARRRFMAACAPFVHCSCTVFALATAFTLNISPERSAVSTAFPALMDNSTHVRNHRHL